MYKRNLNLTPVPTPTKFTAFTLITCASVVMLGSAAASADDRRPVRPRVQASYTEQALMKIRRTETKQLQQIQTGVRNGSLTFKEANRLNNKLARVERKVRRYMRDKRMRAFEARKIGRMQTLVFQSIRKLRSNRVARFGYGPHNRVRPVMRPNPRKRAPRVRAPGPGKFKPGKVNPGKLRPRKVNGHKPMLPAHVTL
jgi:hypothetical protein